VQELAVEAALTGKLEHVFHAMALDPLTSAVLNLEQIKAMTSELLEAQSAWWPRVAAVPLLEVAADD
jgi:alpha-galactosidase